MPGSQQKGHSSTAAMLQPTDVLYQPVPRTMEQAMTTFFVHPSPVSVVLGLVALLAARCQYHYASWWELPVAGCVVGTWLVQEWLVHRKLLHSTFAWFGRDIHIKHHNAAYFHVSIDGPELILPAQILVFALFWTMFEDKAYSLTACATYYMMGLLYLWTHFLVHTHVVPRSDLGRRIRRHHIRHHCHSEDFWLSFLAPAVDTLFGTNAEPRSVPVGKLATGHRNAQDMQRHAKLRSML